MQVPDWNMPRRRGGHTTTVTIGGEQFRLTADGVSHWDTSLVAFVGEAQRWCAEGGVACDTSALPEKMRILSTRFEGAMQTCGHDIHSQSLVIEVGLSTRYFAGQVQKFLQFVGRMGQFGVGFEAQHRDAPALLPCQIRCP